MALVVRSLSVLIARRTVGDEHMEPVRVLLVDDQPLMRAGLRALLAPEPRLRVVGEASDGEEALQLALRLRPDVALMDIRMPGVDGIAATRRIIAEGLPCRVIVLTTFDEDDLVATALRAGASGYLLKDVAAASLAESVLMIARGDAVLSPRVLSRLLSMSARTGVTSGDAADGPAGAVDEGCGRDGGGGLLTQREHDVLALVARGLSNTEIAARLHVQESTVKSHVSSLLAKLGVRDRVQAVVWWFDRQH